MVRTSSVAPVDASRRVPGRKVPALKPGLSLPEGVARKMNTRKQPYKMEMRPLTGGRARGMPHANQLAAIGVIDPEPEKRHREKEKGGVEYVDMPVKSVGGMANEAETSTVEGSDKPEKPEKPVPILYGQEEAAKLEGEGSEVRKKMKDVGSTAGAAAGMSTGASIGTAVAPGIGTAVGAAAGKVIGSKVGKVAGRALYDLGQAGKALAKRKGKVNRKPKGLFAERLQQN